MRLVVDTNIFIAAILKNGACRHILLDNKHEFVCIQQSTHEIENHIQELSKKSKLAPPKLRLIFSRLIKHTYKIQPKDFEQYYDSAYELMQHHDPDDAMFVAAALATNATIWSDDKHLKKQSLVKVYTTKELLKK